MDFKYRYVCSECDSITDMKTKRRGRNAHKCRICGGRLIEFGTKSPIKAENKDVI